MKNNNEIYDVLLFPKCDGKAKKQTMEIYWVDKVLNSYINYIVQEREFNSRCV
jgi:hypothetical protein